MRRILSSAEAGRMGLRARLAADLARAHARRRQVDEAVAQLLEAERITPEQIRSHRVVRQLASDLLSMQDPASSELRELAKRIGA